MDNLILEVKKKKEFSQLPDSLVKKSLELNKKDIKLTRAFLRKYFGVFLTNKVYKKNDESILNSHISSKKRNYCLFYKKIHLTTGAELKEIIDLGCGANGFSYPFILDEFGKINYVGFEATGQICKSSNDFFQKNKFTQAKLVHGDLFDLENVNKIILNSKSPKIIFLLQVVDALESVERNFSKNLLLELKKNILKEDFILVSFSLKSISGKSNFKTSRLWFEKFIGENFQLVENFQMFEEMFFILKNK